MKAGGEVMVVLRADALLSWHAGRGGRPRADQQQHVKLTPSEQQAAFEALRCELRARLAHACNAFELLPGNGVFIGPVIHALGEVRCCLRIVMSSIHLLPLWATC